MYIDKLSGFQFESYICKMMKSMGAVGVQHTSLTGDFGTDVIAYLHGLKYAIQCKHINPKSSDRIGYRAVEEAFAGNAFYNAEEPVVITNVYFTNRAKFGAQRLFVKLIDRKGLIKILNSHKFLYNIGKEALINEIIERIADLNLLSAYQLKLSLLPFIHPYRNNISKSFLTSSTIKHDLDLRHVVMHYPIKPLYITNDYLFGMLINNIKQMKVKPNLSYLILTLSKQFISLVYPLVKNIIHNKNILKCRHKSSLMLYIFITLLSDSKIYQCDLSNKDVNYILGNCMYCDFNTLFAKKMYKRYSTIRKKLISPAVKEVNKLTSYDISYKSISNYKRDKSSVGVSLTIH